MPERFYQMGMAEQLLFSAAAGFAKEGFLPFATTYAAFASRRAYDFIAMAIAEENLAVKITCALPGLTSGYGPSHQAFEDLAIFRGLPNMALIEPCDAIDVAGMVPEMISHPGPVYARLLRGRVPKVLTRHKPDYWFQFGKAQIIREGVDVLVIATGIMTMCALDAAEQLVADSVDVAVLHIPTIKPLDVRTIVTKAGKGRLCVVAENHSENGGLGEAVAKALMLAEHGATVVIADLDEKGAASAASDLPGDGHAGKAEDVAGCALFLASYLSAYCTGTEIDVNGGLLIH